MKLAALFLLVVALFLGAGLWKIQPRLQPEVAAPTVLKTNVVIKTVRLAKSPSDPASREVATPEPFHWGLLESTDFKEYIANLRRVECPEETIRDIILSEINKLYAPREAPFRTTVEALLPWEMPMITASISSADQRNLEQKKEYEKRRHLREIEKEKAALVKELLGIDLPLSPLRSWHSRNYELYEAAINSLPAGKREVVREIQENYWYASDGLNDKYNLRRPPEYLEEYKRLNLDRRAQLAKVLSKDELENYDIRTSNVANSMSSSLRSFKPSEEEFRAIYRARRELEEPWGGALTVDMAESDNENPTGAAERKRLVDDRIKQVIGEERFEEYRLSQDYQYQRYAAVGEQFNLGRETVMKAYELQKNLDREIQGLSGNASMSQADRRAAIIKAQENFNKTLQETVGEKAFNAFRPNRSVFRTQ